jgi:succinoglycan biosynthesis protein ExoV
MNLSYYHDSLNVGDQLNDFIWKKEFKSLLETNEETIDLMAIGSIFNDSFYKGNKTVVFGSGARSGASLPNIDANWDIRFVRGPNTADALNKQGIKTKYITDPGLLISKYFNFEPKKRKKRVVGLIPYYRSNHNAWTEIARIAGLKFISPTLGVKAFCEKINDCDLVLTEAMHGAIIADSFRVPWIAYTSSTQILEDETHNFKWNDWCMSVDLKFDELNYYHFDNSIKKNIIKRFKLWLKLRLMALRVLIDIHTQKPKLSADITFKKKLTELEIEITALNNKYSK